MNGAPLPLEEQAVGLDSRLAVRYRYLQLLIALPLLLLISALAAYQYHQQRVSVQQDMARASAGHVMALESIIATAVDHVARMRVFTEGRMAAPALRRNALRDAFTPRLRGGRIEGYTLDAVGPAAGGAGQLLWQGGDPRRGAPELDLALDFFDVVKLTHSVNRHFQWSYYFPARRDYFTIYPWVPSRELIEGMRHPDLATGVRSWFGYEVFLAGTPDKNPRRRPYWTAPYLDSAGTGAMVSHAAPVYSAAGFMGIVGTDLKVVTLSAFLKTLPSSAGRLLILDSQGMLLADSESPQAATLRRASDVLPPGLSYRHVLEARDHPGVPIDAPGHTLVARNTVDAPWLLLEIVSDDDIGRLLMPRFVPYAIIALALALGLWVSLLLLRREFISPALKLIAHIQRVSNDPGAPEPRLPRLWQTWSAMLTRTFADFREAELVRSAIVHGAPVAVITSDTSGCIVECNPAAEATFGFAPGALLGTPVRALIPARYHEAHERIVARIAAGKMTGFEVRRLERTACGRDGAEFPVEIAMAVSQVGQRTLYTAFVLDLREQKRAEETLARYAQSARHAEKLTAMGSLLAGVAHELNNPLSILIGRASMLAEKSRDTAVTRDAAIIQNAAERCGRIVNMYLSMARQRPAERRSIQLNDVVRSAVELFGYALRTSGVETELDLDPRLPPIEADPDQLGQVVLNLVVNAQQVLGEWRGARRLLLRTEWDGGREQVRLRVRDSGPGVDSALAERIFDPFFTTKADGCGTGMGLSVSLAIVKNHEGSLVLDQAAGADPAGACFTLTLPARAAAAAPCAAAARPALRNGGDKVLIVEDECELAMLMADTLAQAGFCAAVVHDGAAALAWLGEQVPNLILSDVRMPGMDGPALLRALGRDHPQLARRLVFVTGDTLTPGVAEFLQGSGCPWLEKPFTPAQLLEVVRGQQAPG